MSNTFNICPSKCEDISTYSKNVYALIGGVIDKIADHSKLNVLQNVIMNGVTITVAPYDSVEHTCTNNPKETVTSIMTEGVDVSRFQMSSSVGHSGR